MGPQVDDRDTGSWKEVLPPLIAGASVIVLLAAVFVGFAVHERLVAGPPLPSPTGSLLGGCSPNPDEGQQVPMPAAPAFTGPGPHRAIVTEAYFADDSSGSSVDDGISTSMLPAGWRAPHGSVKRAQLVICLTDLHYHGGSLDVCEYGDPADTARSAEVRVYRAVFTFSVLEARSGRKVTTLRFRSDANPYLSCPDDVTMFPEDGPLDVKTPQRIKPSSFARGVRPLITRSR